MNEKKENGSLTPTEQAFNLSKVKLVKNGGITVHYEVTETIGAESYSNKFSVESAKDIHPDLRALFDDLKPVLARIFDITFFQSLVNCKEMETTETQKKMFDDLEQELLGNVDVRGISFSGTGGNNGVVLTGLYTVTNGKKTSINTPKLLFDKETFGFEEMLEETCLNIEKEVYEFLFKGKKAQLELFGSADEDGEL